MESKKRIPEVGDEIYVSTSLYLSHAVDDMIGGLARVTGVDKECDLTWVSIEERPGIRYEWNCLEKEQEKLKEEFKSRRARHIPDYAPKFNDQIYECYLMGLKTSLEGVQKAVRYVIGELPSINAPEALKSKTQDLFGEFNDYLDHVINNDRAELQVIIENILQAKQPSLEAKKISLYHRCQTIMAKFDERLFWLNELKKEIDAAEKEGVSVELLPMLVICHGIDIMAYLSNVRKILNFFSESIRSGTVKMDDDGKVEKNFLEVVLTVALSAHRGQFDKGGAPYIMHPLRVMNQMNSEQEMIVALLHDTVKDTDWTLDALKHEGFSDEVVEAVDCLTRRKGESYEAFIERIKGNQLAMTVKIADLKDNMDHNRLDNPTEEDFQRIEKYKAALSVLTGSND